MITYERAIENILRNSPLLSAEKVLIEDSAGRVLAEDIYSPLEMPPFDKAAMDGYAVKALDIKTAPVELKCLGLIQAGEVFKRKVRRGECVKIMTGAPLPSNTDTVVMVEDTRQLGQVVKVFKVPGPAGNVCLKGEDLKRGQKIISRGTRISPSDIAALATAGRSRVKVIGKPRVAVLNTGGEIVPVGSELAKNKIYNSNGPMLCALLRADGLEPDYLGIVKDNIKDLKRGIKNGLKADMLLISGGVSMGDYDLVPGVLKDTGVRKIFHKVNIKPGKPLFFGRKKEKIAFGIPGNPVSNFLAHLLFIRPALYKMMGYKNCRPEFREGIMEREFYGRGSRKHFVLVKISRKLNRYYITPVRSHGSADILALSKADGFMAVEPQAGRIKKKSKVPFLTWGKI